MKRFKKIMMTAFALFTFCLLFANTTIVDAATEKVPGNVYVAPYYDAKGNVKNTTKKRIVTDGLYSVDVEYGTGDTITNLKSNKKGLSLAITYQYDDGYTEGESTITMYASKAGTYTVSFKVVDSTGKSRGTKKIKVQAVDSDSLIKKATFGKQVVLENSASMKNGVKKTIAKRNTKVSGTSGNLKITANSQYKITGIVVATVNGDGKYAYKKIKNGSKVTLSKSYASKSTSASNSYSSRAARKYTYVYVSYKDKLYGHTATYSVTSKRGRKEIKYVYKNGLTGSSSVTYSKCPSSNISLWQY